MRICEFCGEPLDKKQKRFCSTACRGFKIRGSGKSHIRIRTEGGDRVYFHRYVFEQNVRKLKDGEVVHHLDENKFNNDPENLEALSPAEHLRAHNFWRDRRESNLAARDSEIGW